MSRTQIRARSPAVPVRTVLVLLLALALPAVAQQPAEPEGETPVAVAPEGERSPEPAVEAAAPAPGDSAPGDRPLLDLDRLAEEEAAASAGIPFGLRARPLHGLPAGMAALLVGGREGGQIVIAPLAFPVLVPRPEATGSTGEAGEAAGESAADRAGEGSPPGAVDAEASAAGADAAETGPAVPRAAVALIVEVDGPSLLGSDPGPTPRVELYAYAVTGDGEVAGFLSQSFELDLAEIGEAVFVGGVKFLGHLELPPGDYSLRILVHEPSSQRFGLSAVDLRVPTEPALTAALVAEPLEAPWFLVAEAPHGELGALEPGKLLALAGIAMPSALPLLHGDAARFEVLTHATEGRDLPPRLTVAVSDGEGGGGELVAEVTARQPTGLPRVERLSLEVPFGDLGSGSYFVSTAAEGLGATPQRGVVVLRGDTTATLWPDVLRQISGDAPAATLDLEEVRKRRRGRQRRVRLAVADAYRRVLGRLADADRQGALDGLAEIEGQVMASGEEAPLELLFEAETVIVDALAVAEPQSLLPLMLLHSRAYDRYRDELDYGLSTHSRRMAVAVAERYATEAAADAASDEDRETILSLASSSLASFGAYLQRAQVRVTGRRLLQRALELDAGNYFALLHLATGYERTGDYEEAARTFRRLVEVDPKSPEGRLRLAVNLERLDRRDEAAELLRRLVAEVNPDWVLAVAYQELASMLQDRGRHEEAAALLGQAVGRLPDENRLRIQLAYAQDRAGRLAEARETLVRVSPRAPDSPSPRHLYNSWPETGVTETTESLEEAAMIRLPSLGAVLSTMPESLQDGALEAWKSGRARNRRAAGAGRGGA